MRATHLMNRKTASLFLDINYAFDSVWHKKLLIILCELQIESLLHITRIT